MAEATGDRVADRIADRLARYLGPHTGRVAVKTFAASALRWPWTILTSSLVAWFLACAAGLAQRKAVTHDDVAGAEA